MAYIIKPSLLKKLKTPATRRTIIINFDTTEQTLIRHLSQNEPDGPLTRYAVLEIFEMVLNLPKEKIIQKVNR